MARHASIVRESDRFECESQLRTFLARRVLEMTLADFERDLKIIKTRYTQVERACSKPFPDSTRELNKIVNHWTVEDDWKASPLLLWCMIEPMPQRVPGMLNVNVHLGVAAIKQWLQENTGVPPKNLDILMNAISDARPLQDPFSNDELRFEVDGSTIKVYSVGYNGKDDGDISIAKNGRHYLNEFPFAFDCGVPEKRPGGNFIYRFELK